jgi:hypothetical protein
MNGSKFLTAGLLTLLAGAAQAESGFLTDYSVLQSQQSSAGTDLIYAAPGAEASLQNFDSVMVDEPEIHFSPDSEYKGLKPEDVQAIASILRTTLTEKLQAGGYRVVDQPGANVLYLRAALTELYLKKKKRGLMSYSPVGAVTKAGMDALSDTLDKVDIIEMTLEAELADSQSGNVLGAAVLQRGARKAGGQKEERLDMDEFRATVQEYSDRFRCRLDNARVEATQRIDCYDPDARAAREKNGS